MLKNIIVKDIGKNLNPIGYNLKSPILKPSKFPITTIGRLIFESKVTMMYEVFEKDPSLMVKLDAKNYKKDFEQIWCDQNPGKIFPWSNTVTEVPNNEEIPLDIVQETIIKGEGDEDDQAETENFDSAAAGEVERIDNSIIDTEDSTSSSDRESSGDEEDTETSAEVSDAEVGNVDASSEGTADAVDATHGVEGIEPDDVVGTELIEDASEDETLTEEIVDPVAEPVETPTPPPPAVKKTPKPKTRKK